MTIEQAIVVLILAFAGLVTAYTVILVWSFVTEQREERKGRDKC